MEDFLSITGWLIALGSLIVNIVQLRANKRLKNQISLNMKSSPDSNQQTHSGTGDNINVGGDANINK